MVKKQTNKKNRLWVFQCCSNLNVCVNHWGIFLKGRLWSLGLGWGLKFGISNQVVYGLWVAQSRSQSLCILLPVWPWASHLMIAVLCCHMLWGSCKDKVGMPMQRAWHIESVYINKVNDTNCYLLFAFIGRLSF